MKTLDMWVNDITTYSSASMNVPLTQANTIFEELSVVPYVIGGSFENLPVGSEVILRFPLSFNVSFPASMELSQLVSGVAATAQTVVSFRKNNAEFANATFAAGASTAVFSGALTSFAVGDILTVVCPAVADLTLAKLGWSLVSERVVLDES